MKLKFRPSLKIKRRYLLLSSGSKDEVEKIILDYIGILGWAKAKPLFVEYKKDGKLTVLAVDRAEVDNVKAAFEISDKGVKILRVSGTLKGLRK